jgi:hypothetical protein
MINLDFSAILLRKISMLSRRKDSRSSRGVAVSVVQPCLSDPGGASLRGLNSEDGIGLAFSIDEGSGIRSYGDRCQKPETSAILSFFVSLTAFQLLGLMVYLAPLTLSSGSLRADANPTLAIIVIVAIIGASLTELKVYAIERS